MTELLSLSLVELTERIQSRAVSPVELMQAVLARIDETHADLNAVILRRDPDACLADARAAAERIQSRAVSPVELMQAVLARIDETHADLNAVILRRDPDACLADARAAAERVAAGTARPLEGIPLGVKELEPVAGMAWSECSPLFADRVAEHDSIQVERLKAAGAIVVGKTNAPEFGAPAFTRNRIHGVTRSPPGCCRWSPPATAAARFESPPASPAASA